MYREHSVDRKDISGFSARAGYVTEKVKKR